MTLSFVDRYSKFFYSLIQQKTYNEAIAKESTTPYTRRYTYHSMIHNVEQ